MVTLNYQPIEQISLEKQFVQPDFTGWGQRMIICRKNTIVFVSYNFHECSMPSMMLDLVDKANKIVYLFPKLKKKSALEEPGQPATQCTPMLCMFIHTKHLLCQSHKLADTFKLQYAWWLSWYNCIWKQINTLYLMFTPYLLMPKIHSVIVDGSGLWVRFLGEVNWVCARGWVRSSTPGVLPVLWTNISYTTGRKYHCE